MCSQVEEFSMLKSSLFKSRSAGRNRIDQALRPWEVQPAKNRFVLEGVYLYPEEQAEFSKKSFVLAIRRLLASARALASDGSSASIAEPAHQAEEDHAVVSLPDITLFLPQGQPSTAGCKICSVLRMPVNKGHMLDGGLNAVSRSTRMLIMRLSP
jgi:hypothetical protein